MDNGSTFLITREYLFRLVVDNFDLIEKYLLLKQNRDFVITVFEDSARIANLLENRIKHNEVFTFFRLKIF